MVMSFQIVTLLWVSTDGRRMRGLDFVIGSAVQCQLQQRTCLLSAGRGKNSAGGVSKNEVLSGSTIIVQNANYFAALKMVLKVGHNTIVGLEPTNQLNHPHCCLRTVCHMAFVDKLISLSIFVEWFT